MAPRPHHWWQQTDLLSGLVAAGALVLLVFVVHMGFPLALALAAATYFGVLLATRRPAVAVPVRRSAYETLLLLDGSGRQVPFVPVRRQIEGIVAEAREILSYLSTHAESDALWHDYLQECLESALAGTRRFVTLAPHLTGPAEAPVQKFSEFLSTLSQTLEGVRSRLIGEDAASFENQVDGYRATLQEINQIYLGRDAPK